MKVKKFFFNKYSELRSGFQLLIVVAGIVLSMFLIKVVFAGLIASVTGGNNSALFKIIMQILQIPVIFIPLIAWKRINKRPLELIGFSHKKCLSALIGGLLFGAIAITIVLLLLLATNNISFSGNLLHPHWTADAIIGFTSCILTGFGEEIFFRGYCIGIFSQSRNQLIAVVISAVLFSVAHGSNPNVTFLFFINVVLVGLLFSYMLLKSSSIWLPIGFHIMWNYFEGYVWGFPVSGLSIHGLYQTKIIQSNLLNGGSAGPEGGLMVTFILLLGFLFIKLICRNSLRLAYQKD